MSSGGMETESESPITDTLSVEEVSRYDVPDIAYTLC
jgi:hypothetical protein